MFGTIVTILNFFLHNPFSTLFTPWFFYILQVWNTFFTDPSFFGITTSKKRGICQVCIPYLQHIEEPRCKKCGKRVMQEEIENCYDSTKHRRRSAESVR